MNADALQAHATFIDRMKAVRHVLDKNNLSTNALTNALASANRVFGSLSDDRRRADEALRLVSAAIREFLLARSIAGATGSDSRNPHSARLQAAIDGLANVIGYNMTQPYGRPEKGSLWSALHSGDDYRVNCIAALPGAEYVVVDIRGTDKSTMILLRDWHLNVQPTTQEEADGAEA